jgi:hypothetical protein
MVVNPLDDQPPDLAQQTVQGVLEFEGRSGPNIRRAKLLNQRVQFP